MRTNCFVYRFAALVAVAFCTFASQAATIIKLDLGGVGPDLTFSGGSGGLLSTVDQDPFNLSFPIGDQLTNILFTDFLSGSGSTTGSFTLTGATAVGAPTPLGGGVLAQNFSGGNFKIYNSANQLLISVDLSSTLLVAGSNGASFNISNAMIVGGSPSITSPINPNSIGMSMSLTNISGGGLSAGGGGFLNAFTADASMDITGSVPEPTTMLFALGLTLLPARRSRRN